MPPLLASIPALSAGAVYDGALFQIAQSVAEGVRADNAGILARANAIAANNNDAATALFVNWPAAVKKCI